MVIDPGTPDGAHADRRLRTSPVVWLTTVRADGQPQTSPVWFVWHDHAILLYSTPRSQKVPNIRSNPFVSLNFDGDGDGGDIVTIEGRAEIVRDGTPASELEPYVTKYGEHIARLGAEPEPFARLYSTLIRVTPTRLRVY